MAPKYIVGQKVTIRSAKNQNYHTKYPEIEQYVYQTGTIVEYYWIETSEPNRVGTEAPHMLNNYLYRVQLDEQDKLVAVPEDALEKMLENND